MGAEVMVTWGTWEELLLGGAVLRHGTRDWAVVAAELRARTLSPCTFTPEVCKAKYEDLQQRYSGCKTWFEELRKKRVEELKRALELSEDSIGCLESKLESLKAVKNEKIEDCPVDNGSPGPDLQVPPLKLERVESLPKEMSKDGLSAGSFTHETRANWSPECQVPAVSFEDQVVETKPEVSRSAEQEKIFYADKLELTIDEGKGVSFKKRRGVRKRKGCGRNTSDASVRESDILVSVDGSHCKESSTSNFAEVARSSGIDETKDMMQILHSILETKGASAFRRRHDSQKRARYKKIIRQHMDFDTIRSRISGQIIKSVMELYRDLLLLTNNALVFYSKCTREYKTAHQLRDLITNKLRESSNGYSSNVTHANVSTALPVDDSAAKVRRASPGDCKIVAKATYGGSNDDPLAEVGRVSPGDCKIVAKAAGVVSPTLPRDDDPPAKTRKVSPGDGKIVVKAVDGGSDVAKKSGDVGSPPSVESLPIKKAFGRPRKVGRGAACERPVTPVSRKRRGSK